jgi:hypothetical protein
MIRRQLLRAEATQQRIACALSMRHVPGTALPAKKQCAALGHRQVALRGGDTECGRSLVREASDVGSRSRLRKGANDREASFEVVQRPAPIALGFRASPDSDRDLGDNAKCAFGTEQQVT